MKKEVDEEMKKIAPPLVTREEAYEEINYLQNYYVDKLATRILTEKVKELKHIYFTSDTGTGKTIMIKLLAQKLPQYYFVLTTLSRGRLDLQTREKLRECENIDVFGVQQYTKNSKLQDQDITNRILEGAKGRNVVWIRDEAHQNTHVWTKYFTNIFPQERLCRIVNFSATNSHNDIKTNFVSTLMLRSCEQASGTPEDAIKKLLTVKKQHERVKNYNPCLIFRIPPTSKESVVKEVISLCEKYNLKYINLFDDDFDNNPGMVQRLCEDDDENDVIINFGKIVEGIDIRRAHVLYMTNIAGNIDTTIQFIGRARRNALLWRDPKEIGVDIFSPENSDIFESTKTCYVFYSAKDYSVATDKDGNLYKTFCPIISVEELFSGITIKLRKGRMANGYYVVESDGKSGTFKVEKNIELGFNQLICAEGGKLASPWYDKEFIEGICQEDLAYRIKVYRTRSNGQLIFAGSYDETIINHQDYINAIYRRKKVQFYYDKWPEIVCYETKNLTGDTVYIPEEIYEENYPSCYFPFDLIYNDVEMATLGGEKYRFSKNPSSDKEMALEGWVEEKSITKLIDGSTKFSMFLENKYRKIYESGLNQCFSKREKKFKFSNSKLHSCLGYCVEYYSKYLVYGENYLQVFLKRAKSKIENSKEFKALNSNCGLSLNDPIVVIEACIEKYLENMKKCFGEGVVYYLKTPSMRDLIAENNNFVDLVIELGAKAAEFVKQEMNITEPLERNSVIPCPYLKTKHFAGLTDYLTEDTVIDIKTTNGIDDKMVKQILGYYYLSTKRSDLHIKHLIIYDAISGRCVRMNV